MKGKIAVWRDKIDDDMVNIGSVRPDNTVVSGWGQVHIDFFWDVFNQDGNEYLEVLEVAKYKPVIMECKFNRID